MWTRIDDDAPTHPKILQAGREAAWFWVCGTCYCNKHLTDGFIPEHALPALSPGAPYRRLARLLVNSGLWEETTGGYRVHDFHDYNPEAQQIQDKREQDRIRKRIPRGFHADSNANPSGFQSDSARIPARSRDRDPSPSPVPSRPDPIPKSELALDVCWAEFQAEYPPERRQGGFMAERGFMGAVERKGYAFLLERLRQHKRSEQWLVAKKIPNMRNWFENELWQQELPPPQAAAAGETMDEILAKRKEIWRGWR